MARTEPAARCGRVSALESHRYPSVSTGPRYVVEGLTRRSAAETVRAVTGASIGSIGMMPFRDGNTWFRFVGPADAGTPLELAHGGPGGGHEYLLPLADLLGQTGPVVLHDQTGCGNSTPRSD